MLNPQPQNCPMKQINPILVANTADEKKASPPVNENILTPNTRAAGEANTMKTTIVNNEINTPKEEDDFVIPPQYTPSNVTNCTYCGIAAQTYHCSEQFPICKGCVKLVEQAMYIPQLLPSPMCPPPVPNRIPEITKVFNPNPSNNSGTTSPATVTTNSLTTNTNSCGNYGKVPIQPLHSNSPTTATSVSGKVAIPPTSKIIKKNTEIVIDAALLEKRKNIVWCSTCNKREALCTKDRQYKTCLQCCRKKRNRYRKRKREYSDLAYI